MSKARMDSRAKTKSYYRLSKPGIIYGNLITASAGYFFAANLHINLATFVGLIAGLGLTIAGACATNNYLDRGIDAKMQRTKKRSLVTGELTAQESLSFAAITTALGLSVLAVSQNTLTTALAAFAWFAYVVLYGLGKRYTVHGTLIGCISGSIPLVAGYTAVGGELNLVAVQLFMLMTAWQMAHFYGIALFRLKDYKAAKIPVMPAVYGERSTQWQALSYILLFLTVTIWMTATNSLTAVAGILLIIIGIVWFIRAARQLSTLSTDIWGKKTFLFSLLVMLGMSLCLFANPLLPL